MRLHYNQSTEFDRHSVSSDNRRSKSRQLKPYTIIINRMNVYFDIIIMRKLNMNNEKQCKTVLKKNKRTANQSRISRFSMYEIALLLAV
jgi:hypothetical protein